MGPVSLSLRSSLGEKRDNDSILDFLKRVSDEHGHFRNITEESLQEKIAAEAAAAAAAIAAATAQDVDVSMGEDADEKEDEMDEHAKAQDPELRREEIYKARADMLKLIGQAQNEALTALDFLSLLISKDAPKQAEQSMSPVLKQLVPIGTLGYDKSAASKLTPTEQDEEYQVVLGWNFQSLDAATDRLVQSASRLEKEMQKEAQYWEQVLSVREKGWAVCRMPRERHTLGVRFGFSEASPAFHARGLAALRSDESGALYLDQGSAYREKCLQVRIVEGARVLESSKLRSSIIDSGAMPIEDLLEQSRDSLFDEELFHEVGIEARDLLAYGVTVHDGAIHFLLSPPFFLSSKRRKDQAKCIIELVQNTNENTLASLPSSSNTRAESIALALRILLTDTYRRKAKHRTIPPPPISAEKHLPPRYSILEPVMYHVQHLHILKQVTDIVEGMSKALNVAKVPCTVNVSSPSFSFETSPKHRLTTRMESVVQQLCQPIRSMIVLAVGVRPLPTSSSPRSTSPSFSLTDKQQIKGESDEVIGELVTVPGGKEGSRGSEFRVLLKHAAVTASSLSSRISDSTEARESKREAAVAIAEEEKGEHLAESKFRTKIYTTRDEMQSALCNAVLDKLVSLMVKVASYATSNEQESTAEGVTERAEEEARAREGGRGYSWFRDGNGISKIPSSNPLSASKVTALSFSEGGSGPEDAEMGETHGDGEIKNGENGNGSSLRRGGEIFRLVPSFQFGSSSSKRVKKKKSQKTMKTSLNIDNTIGKSGSEVEARSGAETEEVDDTMCTLHLHAALRDGGSKRIATWPGQTPPAAAGTSDSSNISGGNGDGDNKGSAATDLTTTTETLKKDKSSNHDDDKEGLMQLVNKLCTSTSFKSS